MTVSGISMKTFVVDTETCGKYGLPVLLQYSVDKGPTQLVDIFHTPLEELSALIEDICDNRIVCHNINFDWQMIQKLYNMIKWLQTRKHVYGWLSEVPLAVLIDAEYESRKGFCLKPRSAVDTMILAQKGDGQSSLMAAKPIYIRRVPKKHAPTLAEELNRRTDLPWILFAGRVEHRYANWIVSDRVDDEGNVDPNFVDVQLKFKPSNGLKQLHQFLFNSETTKFQDIMPGEFPGGPGYCPYVAPLLEVCDERWVVNDGKKTYKLWPALIHDHVEFWATNKKAREYAAFDIKMTQDLYEHFGSPENDGDAVLACQIASVRLYGFNIDLDGIHAEREVSQKFVEGAPINVNSPKQVKAYIAEVLDPMEQLIVAKGCDAETLEKIVKEFTLEEEEDCDCEEQKYCKRCGGTGVVGPGEMEVAKRAKLIEEVRRHKKRVELFDKLLLAKRAYPNFRAVGTKSGRLSGTDGLNFQGIDKSLLVRNLFTLADSGEVLSGGDYDGQEVAIAGTTMNDDTLLDEMRKGKKIHGLFAAELFQTTYEDVVSTKDTDPLDRYGKGKSGVFLTIYGGTPETMAQRLGVSLEICQNALNSFIVKYPGVGHTKKQINDRFSAIHRSDEGKMLYKDPSKKYIESIFGFQRYFNTEFKLQRMIFDLVNELFDHDNENPFINMIQQDQEKIVRDTKNMREQSMAAALASAMIGSCYSIGNGVIRAANNHLIQSAGRTITVGLQESLWKLQPVGIHPFVIRPMSVHDEVASVTQEDLVEAATDIVVNKLESQCEIIPLLSMDWGRRLSSWGAMKQVSLKTHDAVHAGIEL